ncbi:MAG TPA: CARDB domain-containing protein, partial [Thermoanaerobaculia bacterium]|nr:CARDB domain-containing protein [Thermoanaerobaculia bacterium]
NQSNQNETEDTAYVTPDADMTVSVTDSPDPVFPNGDITYTVTVGNSGPDAAPTAHLNVFNSGSLRFQSVTAPAGWSCAAPSVGSTPTFTCTNPSFASGSSVVFTVVVRADPAILGITDGTVSTNFTATSSVNDPDHTDDAETEDTAYVTPDANLGVAVTDNPDPVTPDNNITYTVTVTNAGPDAAPNARLNLFNNGSLRFQSVSAPAGWSCAAPSVGSTPTFTCTNPSFASGGNVVFTVVVRADSTILGINDRTVSTNFSVTSDVADPVSANDSETEDTAYVTPDADLHVTNSDAPDPVAPGATITYTQVLTNEGPDAAPNATLSEVLPASVGFQSISAPAGFTCGTPAVGASGTITCTNPSLANGGGGTFTIVVNVIATSGTVTNTVVVGSSVQDPDTPDNSATVTTQIIAPPSADLSITKTTNAANAVSGGVVNYTITVTNGGPSTATNVVVSDPLPSSLQLITATPSQGSCSGTTTITCNLGSILNGGSATISLSVRVLATSGTVSNSASVSATENDPNGGNSASTSASLPVVPAAAEQEDVPTLSEWAVIALIAMLVVVAVRRMSS